MTFVVGLTARKGVGKSTFAAMLADEIEGAEIVGFADALKEDVWGICCDVAATRDGATMRTWLEARKATVFGPLLQGFGEFFREWYGRDYWISAMAEVVRESKAPTIIIPDVRYENEARWITRSLSHGLLISIDGPSRWEGDQRDTSHPSETGVGICKKYAHLTVQNDRTLEHLGERAQYAAGVAQRRGGLTCVGR